MADTDKQAKVKAEFESKIEAKQKEIDGLDEHLATANKYKETYDKRMEENMTEVTERAKVLMSSIDETVKELCSETEKKRETDFQDLDKYCEESQKQKTKYEKQLVYFKQVFGALPDDDDIVEQFIKDYTPKLDAMAISVKNDFPKPLKLMSKSSTEVKACFGKLEEDTYFSPSGIEKPKYRSQLEVELRFKPEPTRSSIFGIQIRPDGKAWITTFNYCIYLVLRTGQIYDECKVKFLPIYTAVNQYGHLYCSSATSTIIRVKKDFDMAEFADLSPCKIFGLHVTEDEHLLVCVQGPQKSKVVKFSEMGMLVQEIVLDTDSEPIFKLPKYITQNGSGQICVTDDKKLIIVEPSGKKYVKYQPVDNTWEGKALIIDKFDNLISSECPLKIRPQNIHIMNSRGESVKTFQLDGPKISGVNALAIDYQYDEPVMWIGTPLGDVIIAKFINTDI
jgi:hypothetical protein